MDIAGRSGWHWAQTRVAQLVLFWGVLDLILRTLDGLTKTDMLAILRESLGPELRLLTDPWLAVAMVALALALLSESAPAKPLEREEADEPPKKKYSVVETAAIPFFLAFVCGVIFPAFESSYPIRPQVAQVRPSVPELNPNAARLLPRRQRSMAGGAAGGGEAAGRGTRLALPELTPALDPGPNASAAESPLSVRLPELGTPGPGEPRAGRTRAKSGASLDAGAASRPADQVAAEHDALKQMEQAEGEKNWRSLASLSESAIADHPQWVTAYWYAGEAYTHLGEPGRAVERLEYVTRLGAANAAERSAVAQAEQLLQTVRQRMR